MQPWHHRSGGSDERTPETASPTSCRISAAYWWRIQEEEEARRAKTGRKPRGSRDCATQHWARISPFQATPNRAQNPLQATPVYPPVYNFLVSWYVNCYFWDHLLTFDIIYIFDSWIRDGMEDLDWDGECLFGIRNRDLSYRIRYQLTIVNESQLWYLLLFILLLFLLLHPPCNLLVTLTHYLLVYLYCNVKRNWK